MNPENGHTYVVKQYSSLNGLENDLSAFNVLNSFELTTARVANVVASVKAKKQMFLEDVNGISLHALNASPERASAEIRDAALAQFQNLRREFLDNLRARPEFKLVINEFDVVVARYEELDTDGNEISRYLKLDLGQVILESHTRQLVWVDPL